MARLVNAAPEPLSLTSNGNSEAVFGRVPARFRPPLRPALGVAGGKYFEYDLLVSRVRSSRVS